MIAIAAILAIPSAAAAPAPTPADNCLSDFLEANGQAFEDFGTHKNPFTYGGDIFSASSALTACIS